MPRKAFLSVAAVVALSALLVLLLHLALRHQHRQPSVTASALGLSNTTYRVADTALGNAVNRVVVTIRNTGTAPGNLRAVLRGDSGLMLAPGLSCPARLAAGGACSYVVRFAPAHAGAAGAVLYVRMSDPTGYALRAVRIDGAGVALSTGQSLVAHTPGPLVASYTWLPPRGGRVAVEFGTDTRYGQSTPAVSYAAGSPPLLLLVAGMQQATTYHMRARLITQNGSVHYDADHTFTTGSYPAAMLPVITTRRTGFGAPQPGLELNSASLSLKQPTYLEAYATDLAGHIVWGYNFADRPTRNTIVQPVQLLPNGDMLLVISYAAQFELPNPIVHLTAADESVDLIREINLAGDPVRQLTAAQLNAELAAQGHGDIVVHALHHDVAVLPSGHMILIASLFKTFNQLPGKKGPTRVLGDVLIDLDPAFHVSWLWNSFDHLDIHRHPTDFPDWTHTNAVLYSPKDGDLLVSMRHQSWVLKLDYANGKGNGAILWRLGYGGDFTLGGALGPQAWFYGQHQPAFVGASTNGQFALTLFDNGYGRRFASGPRCGDRRGPRCYSTVPILDIDEADRLVTIPSRVVLPPALYSEWGGSADALPNGDLEYDLCASPNGIGSRVQEVRLDRGVYRLVWSMHEVGANLYRAHRIPSLYPLQPAN